MSYDMSGVVVIDRRRLVRDVKRFDREALKGGATIKKCLMDCVQDKDRAVSIVRRYVGKDADPEAVPFWYKASTPPSIEADLMHVEDGTSEVVQWVTTREVDRDGEIVLPTGAILAEFKITGMPVLWGHDYKTPPIGNDVWIKAYPKKNPYGLLAKTRYDVQDPFAAQIFGKKQRGVQRSQSIGFMPIEVKHAGEVGFDDMVKSLGKMYGDEYGHSASSSRAIVSKWLMWEHSDVSVPSNPFAVQVNVSKSPPERKRIIVRQRVAATELCHA